jgi:hypothetical protein
MEARRLGSQAGVAALLLLTVAAAAAAAARTEKVTAGTEYEAGAFHRLMLGAGYRALWTTPIEAEVLDLATEAGGLKPAFRVGGQQTKGLAMTGKDGRSYTFRELDKDPSNVLPEELRDTFVETLVQDQMEAQHPAGALIVDELAKAAGVPTVPIRIVVMPDDPALGEFRKEFGGLVGTFSEYPSAETAQHPGFEGAVEIIDHTKLYEKIEASPDDRAAVRELLYARLFDLLVSDFDRHRKQWRWAKRPGDALWHPIPEDRDQAFARYQGLFVRSVSRYVPQLRKFGKHYDSIFGLTYNGREQDRWLLPALSRDAYLEAAKDLQARVSDEVIERAARRMPPEWYAIDGARLVGDMKQRRDTLVEEADRYYRFLAGQVDVQATDVSELARVSRTSDGAVLVEVSRLAADGSPEPPYFSRRFVPKETKSVRIYLRDGNDRVTVDGRPGPIRVRVIGGPGNDLLDDSKGGDTRFYDFEGENRVEQGPGTSWDQRTYEPRPGPKAAPWLLPRDWGRNWYPLPWVSYGSDIGVFLGGGFTTLGYGFRKDPSADQHTLRAGWAFGAQQPRVDYQAEFHRENSRAYAGLFARFSGLDILRYYGFGNDTTSTEGDDYYKVRSRQFTFLPTFTFPVARRLELTVAPAIQYSKTQPGDELIGVQNPYGSGSFGQAGGWVRLKLDTRGALRESASQIRLPGQGQGGGYPVRGVLLQATGAAFPKVWDVEKAYGWVEGSATTFLTAGAHGRATLALRVGGKHMIGDLYPYFQAASIGGGGPFTGEDTVRGLRPNRFIGDSSLYGNAELRLYLSRFFVALPGEWGVFGFSDVGRVWLAGEESHTWHPGWGGGIWIGLLTRSNAIAFTVAKSDERTAFYVRAGFSF